MSAKWQVVNNMYNVYIYTNTDRNICCLPQTPLRRVNKTSAVIGLDYGFLIGIHVPNSFVVCMCMCVRVHTERI